MSEASDDKAIPPDSAEPARAEDTSDEYIKLDQFLKLADLAASGGEAKYLIRTGEIFVNGHEETRRGRKLRHGDVVTVNGEDYVIEAS